METTRLPHMATITRGELNRIPSRPSTPREGASSSGPWLANPSLVLAYPILLEMLSLQLTVP